MSDSGTSSATKAKRSGKPVRSQTRKDKINVVSKASLAMLNPAHAMGIEAVSDLEDYEAESHSHEYDSLREWGIGGPASAGERTRQAYKSFAGPAAWNAKTCDEDAESPARIVDKTWTQSPTPELEAFTMEEIFAGRSDSADTNIPVPVMPKENLAHSLDLITSDEDSSRDVTPRPSLSGRRPSESGKSSYSNKIQNGSSLSRFFSWKRSGKGGSGKGAPPPLPAFDTSAIGPSVPQSAPPTVTSFADSIGVSRTRPAVQTLYKAPLDPSSADLTTTRTVPARFVPVRAMTGPSTMGDSALSQETAQEISLPAGRGAGGRQPGFINSSTNRSWLGRKYSMPTLREVRRAQAQPQESPAEHYHAGAEWSHPSSVATFGNYETASNAPVLPAIHGDFDVLPGSESGGTLSTSNSTSTGMTASTSTTSWGSGARCRISSVGRGSARRAGVDSVYGGAMSPKSLKSPILKSPRIGGSGSAFVLDEEHNQAWFGMDAPLATANSAGNLDANNQNKTLRRRSRSVGALMSSAPPRLSQFGLPPVFTPLTDEVAAFSPLFAWDRDGDTSNPASAEGTPAQPDIEIIDGQAVEVQTRSARRVNLNRGRNGARAVAVASPTLTTRSPRLGQGPSSVSLLSSSSNSPSLPITHSPLRNGYTDDAATQQTQRGAALPVVVNVMPPTPDLASQAQEAFEGKPPSPEVTAGGLVEEMDEADVYDGAVVLPHTDEVARPSPRSVLASKHRDTVIINQNTWAAANFEDYCPPSSDEHYHTSPKTVLRRAALPSLPSTSDLSEFSEDAASSIEDEGPFALARSLSTFSLTSAGFGQHGEVYSPMSSPARSITRDVSLTASPASVASSAALSSLPSLVSNGMTSSSSQVSAFTASSSILDLGVSSEGYFATRTHGKSGAAVSNPSVAAIRADRGAANDEDDCETPRLSGGPQQTRFASPGVLRPSPPLHTRLESPLLELDLSLPLNLDSENINREFHAAASRQSPPRGAHLLHSGAPSPHEPVKVSPSKPPKSRKRGLAITTNAAGMPRHQTRSHSPITPPHTPDGDHSMSKEEHAAALGFGLGLEFGAPSPKTVPRSPAARTQALRIVKRDEIPEDRFNPGQYRPSNRAQPAQPVSRAAHEALWGELGLTGI
ncbi:hypothetical protein CBOM_00140 [Ceraceosorus bombacis]|uniref:Uncharacterized protein n=1 Tax=Ceraceosorus bombacis TaxID=401625 RepID=A0A0P1BA86_9BASI|nr:hypothetical protein CBOM_00140 [Ceraceosorus bombacis]